MHVCNCTYTYRHTLRLAIGIAIANYYGNKQLLWIVNNYYYQHANCTSAHWIDQAIIIILLHLWYNMQNLKAHFQISSIANPSMTAWCSLGHLPMTFFFFADDLAVIVRFLAVRRPLAGGPAVTARAPADRRRDIGRKLCHRRKKSGDRRTVTRRWPADVSAWPFTTWFKVEKIRRWSADALKQESAENRRITARFIKLVT